MPATPPDIAVVPALNAATHLRTALSSLASRDADFEAVLVDGGSRDDTVAIAARAGVRVISAPGTSIYEAHSRGSAETRAPAIVLLDADDVLLPGALAVWREGSVAENPNVSGAIRFRGEEYLSQTVDPGVRKLVLRGLAIQGNLLAVGISAYSPTREGRMKMDGGGVIAFRDEKLVGIIDGPFSQAHDVLPVNGARTDAAGPARSVAELDCMFRRDVGPLLFEGPLLRSDKILPLL
jgi:glycosyltransferase involved in cell wall biosynthesis